MGCPIVGDGEAEVGSLILSLRYYQLDMLLQGFFVRGAISVGNNYMDNEIVFGDALMEAYDTEQSMARDPRIVLAKSAKQLVRKHLKFYGKVKDSPQHDTLLLDTDGQWFIHYLGVLNEDDPSEVDLTRLEAHKALAEARLHSFANQPTIWSKYAWVANYHNFFCSEQGNTLNEYRIPQNLIRLRPSRISG